MLKFIVFERMNLLSIIRRNKNLLTINSGILVLEFKRQTVKGNTKKCSWKKASCYLPIIEWKRVLPFKRIRYCFLQSRPIHFSPKQILNREKKMFTTSRAKDPKEIFYEKKSVRILSRCKKYSILNFSNKEQFFLPKNHSFLCWTKNHFRKTCSPKYGQVSLYTLEDLTIF